MYDYEEFEDIDEFLKVISTNGPKIWDKSLPFIFTASALIPKSEAEQLSETSSVNVVLTSVIAAETAIRSEAVVNMQQLRDIFDYLFFTTGERGSLPSWVKETIPRIFDEVFEAGNYISGFDQAMSTSHERTMVLGTMIECSVLSEANKGTSFSLILGSQAHSDTSLEDEKFCQENNIPYVPDMSKKDFFQEHFRTSVSTVPEL